MRREAAARAPYGAHRDRHAEHVRARGRRGPGHVRPCGTPRRIAYVACDPAALDRDLGYFKDNGHKVRALRAFALFPMTRHVECVAILERVAKDAWCR